MKSLEDALIKVKENPIKFLGKKSMERLHIFIMGYVLSQADEVGTYPEWRGEFMDYVQQKYGENRCIDIATIITYNSLSDEDAFDKYYELLQEFFHKKQSEETEK